MEIGLWLNTLNRSSKVIREHDDKLVIARNQYDEAEAKIQAISAENEATYNRANSLSFNN